MLQAHHQAAVAHAASADVQHSLGEWCESSACSLCDGPFGCGCSSQQCCSDESAGFDGGVTSAHASQLDTRGVVKMLSRGSSDEGHILLK